MPEQQPSQPSSSKPELQFVQDWSVLLEAVKAIQREMKSIGRYVDGTETMESLDAPLLAVVDYVPKLIDAYQQLWELSGAMISAWEQWQASKDTLYVPDAAEMMRGL